MKKGVYTKMSIYNSLRGAYYFYAKWQQLGSHDPDDVTMMSHACK